MTSSRLPTSLAAKAAALTLLCSVWASAMSSAVAATTLLPLGDSITRGQAPFPFSAGTHPASDYRRQDGGPPSDLRSYREHLHDMLEASSCDADTDWLGAQRLSGRVPAVHQGIPGWRFDDYLRESKNWPNQTGLYPNGNDWKLTRWLNEFDADVVLLFLGTNDIGRGESPDSTAAGLEDMLDRIHAANAASTVFVANLPPITGWNGNHRYISPYNALDIAGAVDTYNSLAANIVSQQSADGRDVHLVDVNSSFYVNEGDPVSCPAGIGGDPDNMSLKLCFTQPGTTGTSVPDGLHPGLSGERFIAERFFASLQSELDICGDDGGLDTRAPVATIGVPAADGRTFEAVPTFTGSATDGGGSGFDRVRVVVRDNGASPATWLNFSTGRFERQNGNLPDRNATLSNLSVTGTDWSVSVPVTAAGDYEMFVLAYDNAGNVRENANGAKTWTQRRFLIDDAPTISPDTGLTLSSDTQTFSWNSGQPVTSWWLYLGSTPGARDIHDSGDLGSAGQAIVGGLPGDGRTIHATLFYRNGAAARWASVRASYTAAVLTAPAFNSPVRGSTLGGANQIFSWSARGRDVGAWWLYLGSASSGAAAYDHFSGDAGTSTNIAAIGLPVDGSPVYATLWYRINGIWQNTVYTFTAATVAEPATSTALTPTGNRSGTDPTYTWSAIGDATWYRLWVSGQDGGEPFTRWYTAAQASCTSSRCSVTPTHPISGSSTWWVQTWNASGFGRWSAGRNFAP